MNEAGRIRSALLFIVAGLIVEMFCIWDLKPGTFVVFALVAIPLIAIGMGLFVTIVWRVLRETRGL